MKTNHQNLIHPEKEENTTRIKKIAMRYLLYWACLGLVVLGGCKNCKDEVQPDPCKDQYRTSADFKVEESLGDYWIECDSVNGWNELNKVRFTAKFDADSFIWTIGRETICVFRPNCATHSG